jgi:hypothetical protein
MLMIVKEYSELILPEIVVSDYLGSFAVDSLAPECLRNIVNHLK